MAKIMDILGYSYKVSAKTGNLVRREREVTLPELTAKEKAQCKKTFVERAHEYKRIETATKIEMAKATSAGYDLYDFSDKNSATFDWQDGRLVFTLKKAA